jgi:hypothetical protein
VQKITLNPENYFLLSLVQLCRGRLAEAEAALQRTIELSPNFNFGHYELGLVELARKGAGGVFEGIR